MSGEPRVLMGPLSPDMAPPAEYGPLVGSGQSTPFHDRYIALCRAGDRIAHELSYSEHPLILEDWWVARERQCTICDPISSDAPAPGSITSGAGDHSPAVPHAADSGAGAPSNGVALFNVRHPDAPRHHPTCSNFNALDPEGVYKGVAECRCQAPRADGYSVEGQSNDAFLKDPRYGSSPVRWFPVTLEELKLVLPRVVQIFEQPSAETFAAKPAPMFRVWNGAPRAYMEIPHAHMTAAGKGYDIERYVYTVIAFSAEGTRAQWERALVGAMFKVLVQALLQVEPFQRQALEDHTLPLLIERRTLELNEWPALPAGYDEHDLYQPEQQAKVEINWRICIPGVDLGKLQYDGIAHPDKIYQGSDYVRRVLR